MLTAETILLIEYFEVTIPIVNAIFISIACRFPSAHYDPKLDVYIKVPNRLPPVLKALGFTEAFRCCRSWPFTSS